MLEQATILHNQAVTIAKRFHGAESDLIDILQKIDEEKVFAQLGYGSLFDYATKALKLSEANASNFITVARKSKSIPELKQAIRACEITVSKARKITPVLTKENSSHWIALAKTLPKPKLEREVARIAPQSTTQERAKYVTGNRLELKLGVSEEFMERLRRAQDLTSQRTKRAATLEDTLGEILQIYLQRHDPLEKARRSIKVPGAAATYGDSESVAKTRHIKDGSQAAVDSPENIQHGVAHQNNPNAHASVPGTRYIPMNLKHQIQLRDQSQCIHTDSQGERCQNRRWLQVHHTKPLSKGGTNDLKNLQTLCFSHHKQKHLA